MLTSHQALRHPPDPKRRALSRRLLAAAVSPWLLSPWLLPTAARGAGPAGPTDTTGGEAFANDASRLTGKVVRIHDGDSFVARLNDGSLRVIRMSGIDAPERDQPGGDAARRRLAALLAGQRLRIVPVKVDRFGRTVARVLVEPGQSQPRSADESDGATDVGLRLLAEGHAWHFSRYASEQPASEREAYARAQATARAQRLGLWADDGPVPPWEHRGRRRRDARRDRAREPDTPTVD